jgi:thioredoxin 1
MAPVIEEIAGQTKGKLKVGKLDIDENPTIANQFGISAIPTLIIFKDGKVVETLVGIQSKASIVSALSKYTTIE